MTKFLKAAAISCLSVVAYSATLAGQSDEPKPIHRITSEMSSSKSAEKARSKAALLSTPQKHRDPELRLLQGAQASIKRYFVRADFRWEMAPRFGLDANQNKLPDLPNTFEYVHNLPANYCANNSCAEIEPTFDVTLDGTSASVSAVSNDGAKAVLDGHTFYTWRVQQIDSRTGATIGPISTIDGRNATKALKQGLYSVRLEIVQAQSREADGKFRTIFARGSLEKRVEIRDLLVVSIGDSYSSGQGNPERHLGQLNNMDFPRWADDGVTTDWTTAGPNSVSYSHALAKRSTLAWPAQAALMLQSAQKRSSITFVSLASSGASIHNGLMATNCESPAGPESQLDQLKKIIGKRRIDALFISIGGNDIGFSDIVAGMLLAGGDSGVIQEWGGTKGFANSSHTEQRRAIADAANTGNWSAVRTDAQTPCRQDIVGVQGLAGAYAELRARLQQEFSVFQTYLLLYPDPTGYTKNGETYWCKPMLDDVLAGYKIGIEEEKVLLDRVLSPLNTEVSRAAMLFGWGQIGTRDFDQHGYCAPPPVLVTPTPGWHSAIYYSVGNPWPAQVPVGEVNTSWIRTAEQARMMQGPRERLDCNQLSIAKKFICEASNVFGPSNPLSVTRGVRFNVNATGMAHPNELGHQAMAREAVTNLYLPIDIPELGITDPDRGIYDTSPLLLQERTGIIEPSGDVDIFKVTPSRIPLQLIPPSKPHPVDPLEKIVILLSINLNYNATQGLIPRVAIFDPKGALLGDASSNGIASPDGRGEITMHYTIPKDYSGDYFIAVSDKRNASFDALTGAGVDGVGGVGVYTVNVALRQRVEHVQQQQKPWSGVLVQ